MEYFIILVILFIITFILQKTNNIRLFRNIKEGLVVFGVFFIVGVLWDSFAIWRVHWIINPDKILGIVIGIMPLEEYLFILILPYFILTVYKLIDSKFQGKR